MLLIPPQKELIDSHYSSDMSILPIFLLTLRVSHREVGTCPPSQSPESIQAPDSGVTEPGYNRATDDPGQPPETPS